MKKKFQAIKADVGDYKGIVHDGKEYRFRRDDTFIIGDEGLARELDSMYGVKGTQKLAITPYDDGETRELGHTYTFGALTSPRARENYDHIFRKRGRCAIEKR